MPQALLPLLLNHRHLRERIARIKHPREPLEYPWPYQQGTKPVSASKKFWDKRAERYDAKLYKGPNYAARLERAAAVIEDTDNVLDVGCASGEITLDLACHAGQILGIDHSANMVKVANAKARERGITNVRFEQMEPADPRLADGGFNVISAYSLVHLLDDAPGALARLRDLLVPGGYLITETPCLGDWNIVWRVLVKLAMFVGMAPPVLSLRLTEVASMIAVAGFEVLESKVYNPKSGLQCVLARTRKGGRPEKSTSSIG